VNRKTQLSFITMASHYYNQSIRGSIVADADYHELPEVLRFNKYGGVLSPQERDSVAKSKGLCNKCGKVTHKVTALRSVPLNNDDVKNGVCLICHPEQRGAVKEKKSNGREKKNNGNRLSLVRGAGGKASKLLGDVALPPMPKKASGRRRTRFKEFKQNHSQHSFKSDADGSGSNGLRSSLTGRKPIFKRAPTYGHVNNATSTSNNLSAASAFSHGGVVPLSGSLTMDPLRQKHMLIKMGGQRKMSGSRRDLNKSTMKIKHDFSAPKNNEDAWDIVKEMRGNPLDIELLIRKCHELRSIGTNSAGALYEIIEVMNRHPGERNLQFAAIGALWSVSADGDDDSKAEAIDAGAATVIINALKIFPGDVNLVCWGIGALSSFAEGITGRGSLINSGVIDTLESVLEKYYKAESKVACAICYWVFRCLLLMVISYDDNFMSFMNSVTADLTMNDVELDRDELEVFIKTLSKHNIIHLVVSAMASSSMDAQTLSTAFTFLCHVPNECYIDDEWESLSKVVPPVIQEKTYASFPVMKLLAFAIQCELMKKDPSFPSSLSGTSDAVREALGKLTPRRKRPSTLSSRTSSVDSNSSKSSSGSSRSFFGGRRASFASQNDMNSDRPPDHIITDIMIYTLSHALTYSDIVLGFTESKTALKSAIHILGADEAPMFSKISCCWIIFGVFRGSDTIKNTTFTRQAAGSIQSAMIKHQSSPHLLTIGFAALSAAGKGITHVKALVDMVLGLKSKFPDEKSLLKEACRFLSNCCESKQDVDYVLSAGGLELATILLNDEEKSQGREAVHLVYKFVLFAGSSILTLDKYHAILNVRDLAKHNVLLAAEMVYCLTKAVTVRSDAFEEEIKGSLRNSIRRLTRNDSKGILYPVAETFMFFDFVVEVSEVFGNNRNFMKCACLAIKHIALTAQRAKLKLEVERPISVVQKALANLKGLHAPIDAIWAMLGVDHASLGPDIARDVTLSMIDCINGSMGMYGHQFLESVVHASLAVLSFIFSEQKNVKRKKDVLELETVEKVVELVLAIFFSCLDKHGNFPSIFKFGFRLLQSLCDDHNTCGIIIKHGGIVAVIDAMMTNSEDVAIQTSGCIILRSLSEIDNMSAMNVVEADGVDLLLDIVTTPDTDLGVIAAAMRAILSLSLGQESRLVVEQEGGISVISEAMSEFTDSAQVQETGLATLCFLAAEVDDSFLEASSFFTTVHNALTHHQGNANVHQHGFALLEMLSLKCDAIRNNFVSSGCINCVIEAVMTKEYPSRVVANAFEILINLMIDSEGCRQMISTPEMLEATIFSMMLHIECYKIQLDGCQLLFEMCKIIDNSHIVEAGGVKASLCAMMAHSISEDIQTVACTLFCHLSPDLACLDGGSSGSNLGPNILEAILSAMDNFPGSQQVQAKGTHALEKMVERKELRDHTKSELPRIRNALRNATRVCPTECAVKASAIQTYLKQ